MQNIERMLVDPTVSITKKERLVLSREREKLVRVLGGIENISRIPAALFLVDIGHEHIALAEAKRLNLVTFGMVDTNCDPNQVDFAIPANGRSGPYPSYYQLSGRSYQRRTCRPTKRQRYRTRRRRIC